MGIRSFAAGTLAALTLSSPVAAQEDDTAAALFNALRLPEMLEIMREEGLGYGTDIGADLFMGGEDPEWQALVDQIYDYDRMIATVSADFEAALDGADTAAMLAFFESEPGVSIVSYEVAARSALLDDDVEEAAKVRAAAAISEETDRYSQIESFVAANDLIETNVVGAMNSNYAFYMGLLDGGAIETDLTEDQVLADVWAQEPEIRANTTEWVYSFLFTAYDPVSDNDLDTYIAFSETDAGKRLNAALFTAFDGMFVDISRALGLGAAQFMVGQDI